jgi:ABC-type nickel/cobalt efflux system permease component RcnA
MNSEIFILSLTAASIGFMHTLFGPDHYLPFVVLSKARKWSRIKTIWITILCGLGHVGSSVVIGFIGIAAGVALSKLQYFESVRGNIAGWLFIGFGLAYALWGLRRAYKNKPHSHPHFHLNGEKHVHEHTHFSEHTHLHDNNENVESEKMDYKSLTPWILFVIFVLGPCEPLIPLLMFPALKHSMLGVVSVTTVFSLITIATMTTIVLLMTTGIKFIKFEKLEKYTHALAGAAIFFSGVAIQFLGL